MFTRVPRFFNIFKFLKSRNLESASFSLLRNLMIRLHLKFLPKLRNNCKNITFPGRPAANCTPMANSIRVAQPNGCSCTLHCNKIHLRFPKDSKSVVRWFRHTTENYSRNRHSWLNKELHIQRYRINAILKKKRTWSNKLSILSSDSFDSLVF